MGSNDRTEAQLRRHCRLPREGRREDEVADIPRILQFSHCDQWRRGDHRELQEEPPVLHR